MATGDPKYDIYLGKIIEEQGGLSLDQTTQQTVINGLPIFGEGLIIKAGEKLIFDG